MSLFELNFQTQLCASRSGSGPLGVITIPCEGGPKVYFDFNHVGLDIRSLSGGSILDNPASSRL